MASRRSAEQNFSFLVICMKSILMVYRKNLFCLAHAHSSCHTKSPGIIKSHRIGHHTIRVTDISSKCLMYSNFFSVIFHSMVFDFLPVYLIHIFRIKWCRLWQKLVYTTNSKLGPSIAVIIVLLIIAKKRMDIFSRYFLTFLIFTTTNTTSRWLVLNEWMNISNNKKKKNKI